MADNTPRLPQANTVNRPYFDVPYLPFDNRDSSSRHGSTHLRDVKELQVGYGSEVFRVDKDGMWAGAEDFASAPWTVDWQGNMTATSITISGYIPTGGALTDIGAGNITSTYIGTNAITTTKINSNAITTAKINAGAITTAKIATNAVTANEIAANTITASQIAASTITGTQISASAKIVAGTGNNVGVLDGAHATYRIYAGHATAASAPFRVTQTGSMTATSGAIGGWTLGSTTLTATNVTIDSGNQKIKVGGASSYAEMISGSTTGAFEAYVSGTKVMSMGVVSGSDTNRAQTMRIEPNVATAESSAYPYGAFETFTSTPDYLSIRVHDSATVFGGMNIKADGEIEIPYGHLDLTGDGFVKLSRMTGTTASGLTASDGSMYYRTDDDVIRVRLNGTWYSVDTS